MIVVDADFLSSLIKIERLNILHKLVKGEVCIPNAVKNEIEKCPDLCSEIDSYKWLKVVKISKSKRKTVKELQDLNFGLGESECIALGDIIFMSDSKAGRYAYEIGKTVIDIPTFLLMCKRTKLIGKKELEQIIKELRIKDNYHFSKEWLKRLL